MINEDISGVDFSAVLYDVRTKRDGGGRLTLDFGRDALQEIQYVQKMASQGDVVFQIAIVALPRQVIGGPSDEEVEF